MEREKALKDLNQKEAITLAKMITKERLKNIEKIGEGAFGEVFQCNQNGQTNIIKV